MTGNIALILSGLFSLCGDFEGAQVIGVAKNFSGKPLYCENHYLNQQSGLAVSTVNDNRNQDYRNQESSKEENRVEVKPEAIFGSDSEANTLIRVEYRNLDNDMIAIKRLNFGEDKAVPEVVQKDFRAGEERQIIKASAGWQLKYRADESAAWKSVVLDSNQVEVIDAGFDSLIRSKWETLITGKRVTAKFASAPHQRVIALTIRRRKPDYCGNSSAEWQEKDTYCFSVQAANTFIKLFFEPLRLSYDTEKRLRMYRGVVNLPGENGKSQKAEIHYLYCPCDKLVNIDQP